MKATPLWNLTESDLTPVNREARVALMRYDILRWLYLDNLQALHTLRIRATDAAYQRAYKALRRGWSPSFVGYRPAR